MMYTIHYRHIKKLCRQKERPTHSEFTHLLNEINMDVPPFYSACCDLAQSVIMIKYKKDILSTYDHEFICNTDTERPILWIIFKRTEVDYAISFDLYDFIKAILTVKKDFMYIKKRHDIELYSINIYDIYKKLVKHFRWQYKQHGVKNAREKLRFTKSSYGDMDSLNITMTRIITTYLKQKELWNKQ